jgi:hypothetical protein
MQAPSPAQYLFEEAMEWERQFRDALASGDMVGAWNAQAYAGSYAALAQAAATMQGVAKVDEHLGDMASVCESAFLQARLG